MRLGSLLVSSALLLATPTLAAQDSAAVPADSAELHWVVAPPILPPGATIAVVSGDPTAPGRSVIQLSMPNGYRMSPHFHPHSERVEVKRIKPGSVRIAGHVVR